MGTPWPPDGAQGRHGCVLNGDGLQGPLAVPGDFVLPPPEVDPAGHLRHLEGGGQTFTIDYGSREETISIDRLKPAHTDLQAPVQVAQPPRRGRPPQGPAPTPPAQAPAKPAPSAAQQTRSGHSVRRPRRLNLYIGLLTKVMPGFDSH